ncbi:MAG: hypothetical protein ACE5DS_06510 [Kiloniellaceae bacterium]
MVGVLPRRFVSAVAVALAAGALAVPAAPRAEAVSVTIARADCLRLTAHMPAPDVAYQPGVDVQGRPVVPADLGRSPAVRLPDVIELDIEVDLQDRFGFPANRDLFEADAQIGIVRLFPDGRATLNGQPLQDETQAALAARCQEILYGRP